VSRRRTGSRVHLPLPRAHPICSRKSENGFLPSPSLLPTGPAWTVCSSVPSGEWVRIRLCCDVCVCVCVCVCVYVECGNKQSEPQNAVDMLLFFFFFFLLVKMVLRCVLRLFSFLISNHALIAALLMAGSLAGVVALLESFVPWYTQVGLSEPPFPSDAILRGEVPLMSLLQLREWPAYVAGAGIGLLQVPLITLLRQTIGTSSSYVTCVANSVCSVAPNSELAKNQYLQRKKYGYWQIGLIGGVMAGAYLSSSLRYDSSSSSLHLSLSLSSLLNSLPLSLELLNSLPLLNSLS
jgi:Sulphur transport